jgi:hypothetical protein
MSRELDASQNTFSGAQCHIAACSPTLLDKFTAIEKLHEAALQTHMQGTVSPSATSIKRVSFDFNPVVRRSL